MDRAMRIVFIAGLTLLTSGIAFSVYLAKIARDPAPVAVPQAGGVVQTQPVLNIPAFNLVDQEGRAIDRSILEGRVSIVWFMFTHCPLACPDMSIKMADMQRKLKGSGVRFTAFTLDPTNDTPARLKTYGQSYDIDWSTWTLLTEPDAGPKVARRTGWDIYSNDLFQSAEELPQSQLTLTDGSGTMNNIEHGVNFFLVGPDGRVLTDGWFSSKRPEEMSKLRERALGAVRFFGDKGLLKP